MSVVRMSCCGAVLAGPHAFGCEESHEDQGTTTWGKDNCSDGCHIFKRSEWDGALRCSCGKVMDTTARSYPVEEGETS